MLDTDSWIKAALRDIDIPMSREPMLTGDQARGWLIWRQTGERSLFASGQPFDRRISLTLTLACTVSEDHQQLAADIVDRLRRHTQDGGRQRCAYARIGGDSWDPTIARRSVIIFLGIREVI